VTSPASDPPPQPLIIAADESQVRPQPFSGPLDRNTQAATSGIEITDQQWLLFEQPFCDISPQFQPQAPSAFDQPPSSLPLRVLNQLSGITAPNLRHMNGSSTSSFMNAFPPNVNNAGHQSQFTEHTQHAQTSANYVLTNQQFSQSNMNRAQRHDLAFRQPGPGPLPAPNYSNQFVDYLVPQTYFENYSTLEDAARGQTSTALPSSRRLWGQCYIGSSEELTLNQDRGHSVSQSFDWSGGRY
jgi:hypothetical protein